MSVMMSLTIRMQRALRENPVRFLATPSVLRRFTLPHDREMYSTRYEGVNVIWDVGAAIGKATVPLAKANPRSRIVAFEPNLNALYFLAHNCRHLSNVVIVPMALTSAGQDALASGSADFYCRSECLTPTMSIEKALNSWGYPGFVKMDCEGGEYELLPKLMLSCPSSMAVKLYVSYHGSERVAPWPGWRVEQRGGNSLYLHGGYSSYQSCGGGR